MTEHGGAHGHDNEDGDANGHDDEHHYTHGSPQEARGAQDWLESLRPSGTADSPGGDSREDTIQDAVDAEHDEAAQGHGNIELGTGDQAIARIPAARNSTAYKLSRSDATRAALSELAKSGFNENIPVKPDSFQPFDVPALREHAEVSREQRASEEPENQLDALNDDVAQASRVERARTKLKEVGGSLASSIIKKGKSILSRDADSRTEVDQGLVIQPTYHTPEWDVLEEIKKQRQEVTDGRRGSVIVHSGELPLPPDTIRSKEANLDAFKVVELETMPVKSLQAVSAPAYNSLQVPPAVQLGELDALYVSREAQLQSAQSHVNDPLENLENLSPAVDAPSEAWLSQVDEQIMKPQIEIINERMLYESLDQAEVTNLIDNLQTQLIDCGLIAVNATGKDEALITPEGIPTFYARSIQLLRARNQNRPLQIFDQAPASVPDAERDNPLSQVLDSGEAVESEAPDNAEYNGEMIDISRQQIKTADGRDRTESYSVWLVRIEDGLMDPHYNYIMKRLYTSSEPLPSGDDDLVQKLEDKLIASRLLKRQGQEVVPGLVSLKADERARVQEIADTVNNLRLQYDLKLGKAQLKDGVEVPTVPLDFDTAQEVIIRPLDDTAKLGGDKSDPLDADSGYADETATSLDVTPAKMDWDRFSRLSEIAVGKIRKGDEREAGSIINKLAQNRALLIDPKVPIGIRPVEDSPESQAIVDQLRSAFDQRIRDDAPAELQDPPRVETVAIAPTVLHHTEELSTSLDAIRSDAEWQEILINNQETINRISQGDLKLAFDLIDDLAKKRALMKDKSVDFGIRPISDSSRSQQIVSQIIAAYKQGMTVPTIRS